MQQLIAILHRLLPQPVKEEPTTDGVLLTAGDPGLVSIRMSMNGLIVSAYGIHWDDSHTPVRNDRELCKLSWQELPNDVSQQAVIAKAFIQAVIALRQSSFRICKYCNKAQPPEWQHDTNVCQGCAEKHLGVVH